MKRLALVLIFVLAARACCATPRRSLVGQVVKIADGDTLTVLDPAHVQHKIRLAGIDAPEKAQAFGTQARNALAAKVFRRTVRVEVTDTDRYGREVGRVFCSSHFINAEMVREGFAWRYPQWDKAGEFATAEADARRHRRGLWADRNPVPPWEFRKATRVMVECELKLTERTHQMRRFRNAALEFREEQVRTVDGQASTSISREGEARPDLLDRRSEADWPGWARRATATCDTRKTAGPDQQQGGPRDSGCDCRWSGKKDRAVCSIR
jgi:endonuclease YncB( thermonuclease family)